MPEIQVPALRIQQPLGAFVVFSMPASKLLPLTYAQPATLIEKMDEEQFATGYGLFGTQRRQKPRRLEEISRFIRSRDATFPNAIILAANYARDGQLIEEDRQWRLIQKENGAHALVIPEGAEAASIIDGQHRLMAFKELPTEAENRDMELLCVAFLDLPTPFHAFVFATINFNQVKVDRSLAYQLFGFQVEQQKPSEWVPETTAVAIGRLLASSIDSPLRGCVSSGLIDVAGSGSVAGQDANGSTLKVSMATIVDGILRLITRDPRRDRDLMRSTNADGATRAALPSHDEAPLRRLYIQNNDRALYETTRNYFIAVSEAIWAKAPPNSYLKKTVGIQAQFDVLKHLLTEAVPSKETTSAEYFRQRLSRWQPKQEPETYQASGIGRTRIRDDILAAIRG